MTVPFHIAVIAKEPVVGKVKTGLVPPLSQEQAAQIAAACLHDTFTAVSAVCAAHDDVRAVALIDGAAGLWIPADYDMHRQRGNGLGECLSNGFADLGPGLVIGMDTPSSGKHLEAALEALRGGNDALGMTHGGGCWGIALASVEPAAFDNVPMSTDHTGQAQLDQLQRLGRRVTLLPTVHDLDHFEDIAPIVADLPGSHLASVAGSLFNRRWG